MGHHLGSSFSGGFLNHILLYEDGAPADKRQVDEADVKFLTAQLKKAQEIFKQSFGDKLFTFEIHRDSKNHLQEPIPQIVLEWDVEQVIERHILNVTGVSSFHKSSEAARVWDASQTFFNRICNETIASLCRNQNVGIIQTMALDNHEAETIKAGLQTDKGRERDGALERATRLLREGVGIAG